MRQGDLKGNPLWCPEWDMNTSSQYTWLFYEKTNALLVFSLISLEIILPLPTLYIQFLLVLYWVFPLWSYFGFFSLDLGVEAQKKLYSLLIVKVIQGCVNKMYVYKLALHENWLEIKIESFRWRKHFEDFVLKSYFSCYLFSGILWLDVKWWLHFILNYIFFNLFFTWLWEDCSSTSMKFHNSGLNVPV